MNVEVYLTESSIRLVEAMERQDSRAIIVKTPSIKVNYSSTTVPNQSGADQRADVQLHNFMAYKCMLMDEVIFFSSVLIFLERNYEQYHGAFFNQLRCHNNGKW
jgi:hypothetical protein